MNNSILLIDDDPEDHEIFEFALEMAIPDAVCEHSFNCQDAVDKIKKGNCPMPGNIFLDVNMPQMELPKCLFSIHEALGDRAAEIIILTGFRIADLPDHSDMKVISKPNTVELLAQRILEMVVIK